MEDNFGGEDITLRGEEIFESVETESDFLNYVKSVIDSDLAVTLKGDQALVIGVSDKNAAWTINNGNFYNVADWQTAGRKTTVPSTPDSGRFSNRRIRQTRVFATI